jgi:hypothetical protein
MHAEFGPWATALTNRFGIQLSSFWKTRMALLQVVAHARPRCSRRAAVILVFTAVALASMPLIDLQQALIAPVHAGDFPSGSLVPGPKSTPVTEKAWRTLAKPTTVEFLDLPLADALRFVQEYHNVAMRRDDATIKAAGISLDRPVTMRLMGTSLRSVLRLLVEPAGLDLFVDETGLVITTRDEAAAKLSELVYPLGDVARAGIPLGDLGDVIIQCVDPTSWRKKGGQGLLRVERDKTYIKQRVMVHEHLDDFLRELFDAIRDPRATADDTRLVMHEYAIGSLQNLGAADRDLLAWINESLIAGSSPNGGEKESAATQGNRLILTQPAWVHPAAADFFRFVAIVRQGFPDRAPTREEFLLAGSLLSFDVKRRIANKRLAQPVTADFLDLPLEDALTFLKEYCHTKMIIADDIRGDAKLRDAPVTTKANQEALSAFLDKLLQPLNLDWYLVDSDVVVISKRATASLRMEPRVYRTKELLAAGQTENGLAEQIRALDSWSGAGRPGQMRFLPGVLIASQNQRVHRQISRLLTSFEKDLGKPAK